MIGYLTKFDNTVVGFFVILFVCCTMHQIRAHIEKGSSKSNDDVTNKVQASDAAPAVSAMTIDIEYSLHRLYAKICDAFGRLFIIPIIWGLFSMSFQSALTPEIIAIGWTVLLLFEMYVARKSYYQIRATILETTQGLEVKLGMKDSEYSKTECLFYNLVKHGKLSWTLDDRIKQKRETELTSMSTPEDQIETRSNPMQRKGAV